MSEVYAFICVKSTIDPFIPSQAYELSRLSRDVSDAFAALAGGFHVVGKIAFFPLQRSVPFHLLCDGKEVPKASFPELFEYLGTSQGAATDPASFKLPNYVGSLTPAATVEPETVSSGTVTSAPSGQTPPTTGTGSTAPVTSGSVNSGGRPPPHPV